MKRILGSSFLAGMLLVTGCRGDVPAAAKAQAPAQIGWPADPRAQCQMDGNSKNNPCDVSVFALVGDSVHHNGEYVDFVAFHPGDKARLLFVSRDAAQAEDYASAILILDESVELPETEGYIRVAGRFERDLSDHDVAAGTNRQFGSLTDVLRLNSIISVDERRKFCATRDCKFEYSDGSRSTRE